MEENLETGLERVTDAIGTAITGIPAPVRKNFFKALAQLSTAAVDVPVTWLEGKASEMRAATEARVQIIKKEGEIIAGEIQVPQKYIDRASVKYASKVVKEQINLDEITLNAAKELSDENVKTNEESTTEDEIEDDWLNEFESHAKLKSSDEMKLLFGKILAGEIVKPGTFSIKTIRLISQLDSRVANLFKLLCSQSVSLIAGQTYFLDTRVISLNGNAASNALASYGLSFDNLNILQEHGLIISDYNSYMSYGTCIANEDNKVATTLYFNKKHYGLIPNDRLNYEKELKLHGVALTKAGRELFEIVSIEENEGYSKALFEFFGQKQLTMQEIKRS